MKYLLIYITFLISFLFSQDIFSDRFHSLEEIEQQIIEWDTNFGNNNNPYEIYPGDEGIMFHQEIIGYSEVDNLPIWAIKLSFNANVEEDQPKVLILGHVHAEEIYGIEIVMDLIDRFLYPYPEHASDLQLIYEIMSKVELWIVPTYNPDGLRVVHGYDDGLGFIQDVFYRKNKFDANHNGVFDFFVGPGDDIDGVDLNRNFGFNWIFGDDFDTQDFGSCNPSYITNFDYYRGEGAFTENEVSAIRDFALNNNFLLSIAYHSSRSGCVSEKVIYPWLWDGNKASPDLPIISRLGEEIASLIPKETGGGYYQAANSISRKGNAHDWFYRNTGCFQYLIETGTENIQPTDSTLIEDTIERNMHGVMHMLKRAAGIDQNGPEKYQITGIVTDQSGSPLNAQVSIAELTSPILIPRYTDSFGRYRRLLVEGTYNLVVESYGYETYNHEFIPSSSTIYEHNVEMQKLDQYNLNIDFNIPENYDLPIAMKISHPLYSDTLFVQNNNLNFDLYHGDYTLTILGDWIFPETFDLSVNNNVELSLDLKYQGVAYLDTFDDMQNWSLENGWSLNEGKLISRDLEDKFYNNIESSSAYTNVSFPSIQSDKYILEMNLKSELEWEKDYLDIYIPCNGCDDIGIYRIDDQNWNNHNLIMPFNYNGEGNTSMYFDFKSDSTLYYRGLEIDYMQILFEPDGVCFLSDINLDGHVNIVDVVKVINFIFETDIPIYHEFCSADLNEDSILNVLDVVLIVDSIFNN